MTATNLYETDFIAWTERQATLLRTPISERCSLALDCNRCEASTYAFHARMGMMGAIPA